MRHRLTATLALAGLLAGCTAGRDYRRPAVAALGVPAAYAGPSVQAGTIDMARWWDQFRDPMLAGLIAQAAAGNLDIAVAEARLRQARESLVVARAAQVPTLSSSASGAHTITRVEPGGQVGGVPVSPGSSASNQLALKLDAAWQADLFGGNRRSVEAARASVEATGFRLARVRTAIAGEVAINYIDLRAAQARLAIARDTLRQQDENLTIAGLRAQAGLVSAVDREQARAQRAQTAASIPGLESAIAGAANRLGVLTGQSPESQRALLAAGGPVPAGPDGVAVGIPADTLRQRPDVRAAERDLAAATAQIGVAEAQLYPALSLSGTIGTAASSVSGLGQILTTSLFAGLSQTIFAGNRLHAQVRSARADADAAFATYKQTVLLGLEEVENALEAFAAAKARTAQLAIAFDASNNAAILAREQYRAGLTDFLAVLQSEQSLLASRDALASADADRAAALVRLYLALGGGWTPVPPASGTPS